MMNIINYMTFGAVLVLLGWACWVSRRVWRLINDELAESMEQALVAREIGMAAHTRLDLCAGLPTTERGRDRLRMVQDGREVAGEVDDV